jgi:hypothetical protein
LTGADFYIWNLFLRIGINISSCNLFPNPINFFLLCNVYSWNIVENAVKYYYHIPLSIIVWVYISQLVQTNLTWSSPFIVSELCISQIPLNYLTLRYLYFVLTWWRLFQKRVDKFNLQKLVWYIRTKHIYVSDEYNIIWKSPLGNYKKIKNKKINILLTSSEHLIAPNCVTHRLKIKF